MIGSQNALYVNDASSYARARLNPSYFPYIFRDVGSFSLKNASWSDHKRPIGQKNVCGELETVIMPVSDNEMACMPFVCQREKVAVLTLGT